MHKDLNMENTSNIRFAYFKAQTSSGVGIICMALSRPPKDSSSTTYRAGFAFYSPNETEAFSKDRARKIALGRLNNWRLRCNELEEIGYRLEFDFSECGDKLNLQEVFAYGMKEMLATETPRWAQKAFERGQLLVGLTEVKDRQVVL